MKTITKLWLLVMALIVLAPLGIIIPLYFKSGAAWGEWTGDEVKRSAGYLPKGMERLASLWHAPISGYGNGGIRYIISAVLGIAIIAGIIFIAGKLLNRQSR